MKKVPGKPDTVYMNIDKKKTLLAMKLVNSEETKKKLDLLHDNIGKEKNIPIMNKLIQKRDTYAKMLGFSSNAEYVLSSNRMAGSVKNVEKMLDDLTKRITPMGRKEL